MQSIQVGYSLTLDAVKPLERLQPYRKFCLEAVQRAFAGKTPPARKCPVDGCALQPWGKVAGLDYLACEKTGSLFFAPAVSPGAWENLLKEVNLFHASPKVFDAGLKQSRLESVFEPKREWIASALRLAGLRKPSVLEAATLLSPWTDSLKRSALFETVTAAEEMGLIHREALSAKQFDAAILFESLDRVDLPHVLLEKVFSSLKKGGLVFITALVSSGFDFQLLGSKNNYLCPPDRTNCFSLLGLEQMVTRAGFELLEVSTPGVLDVEIVKAHLKADPGLPLSAFEKSLIASDPKKQKAFQEFLQSSGLSSFARIVAQKT